MNALNDALIEGLKAAGPRWVCSLIERKIAEQGFSLSERQKRAIAMGVESENFGTITLRSWKWWERKQVRLEFTPEDLDKLDKFGERLAAMIPELVKSESKALAPPILATLKARWKSESHRQKKEFARFRERLAER